MITFLPPEASGTPFLWLGYLAFPPHIKLQPHRLHNSILPQLWMLPISPLLVHASGRSGIAGISANCCLGIFHCLYRSSLHQVACSHFPPKLCGINTLLWNGKCCTNCTDTVLGNDWFPITGTDKKYCPVFTRKRAQETFNYSCGSGLWALGCSAGTYVFLPDEESVKLYPLQTLLLESCHFFL